MVCDRMIRFLAALGVMVCATGCATSSHTSGRPIEQAKVDRIVKGQTTKDQIIEWFGAPTDSTEMSGEVLYTYRHTVTKGSAFSIGYYGESSGKEQSDELTITFVKDSGKVKTYSVQRGIQ
jgi:outer membrane protein assembly factor BamE (lipoprotein component of BamABCDE complex)